MPISEIIMYNPWWNSSINMDTLVKKLTEQYENARFKRDYSNLFDLSSNALYTLRGMRQIGKSTAIKITIAELLKKNVPGKSIMFLPSDTVADFKELKEVLLEYLNYAREYKKRYIFIDEISYVKGWQRAIKELRDNTILRNDLMILSGSSALDIKRGAERMPGRRGNVVEPDKVLLPVTFREYLEIIGFKSLPLFSLDELLTLNEKYTFDFKILENEINPIFDRFLLSGGIPVVVEKTIQEESLEQLVNVFWDIMVGDIEKVGLNRITLRKIIKYLVGRIGSRLSWNSVGSEVELDTKTVQRYLEAITSNYLGFVIHFLDKNKHTIKPLKQKKFYLWDSFLNTVIQEKLGVSTKIPELIEQLVGKELLIRYENNLSEGSYMLENVGFWYSQTGNEVDYLVKNIPIEVKYKNNISKGDAVTITKAFGKGILLTKKTLDLSSPVKRIPVSLFLAVLSVG
ncbi:ATP-binding protein [Kosmotoga olearia]|uniref:ATPase (AAA+ superfamily)-like protein n=1 Tax=Kosmotoga olearia (strain ATCC BAA-1733 / DSM 21960 / TBF 19.5.1) TaxID=521045 RepID=C5CJ40_KOSOT|nr:ATP-binding protein [Kosmotoga olearia]ACR79956.1 ATPase (AAA+ superfamily)-like protein [Kosmotoga olearia TBF 19.5.1]MDK2954329.1 uncharacterized protein [Kosmotoga sp.]